MVYQVRVDLNHMGRNSPRLRDAEANPASPWRDWFCFGPQYPGGARSWWLAGNLPELNLENPQVRDHVCAGRDSVVRSYLRVVGEIANYPRGGYSACKRVQ